MSFGTELKDQVTIVNQFVQGGIQFLTDFREFIKERAQIEKDYSHKLETLSKKYAGKKDKKAVALSIGENAVLPSPTSNTVTTETSTFVKAWTILLEEIENIARDRFSFSETLSNTVIDQIKTVASRKEESRKKHMVFAQKLISDRDKIYSEKQKAKTRYDESCFETQSSQQKQERALDDKTLEKLKNQYNQDIVEMNNNKNLYILSVRIANEQKKKHYHTDLPALTDRMQILNESRIESTQKILYEYIEHELSILSTAGQHLEVIKQALQQIDGHVDSQLFIKYNKKEWIDPPDFVFEPCSAWENTAELATDENAKVFLSNKLVKTKKKLNKLASTIQSKEKEITGMESLINAYSKNPSLGDPDTVTENLLDALREVTVLETMRTTYQTEIDSIITASIDILPEQQPHEFKNASFTIPTTCDLCRTSIWGIARQGFMCKECGYNCHAKCEMKVPPSCTRKKGVINRGAVASMAFSATTSPYSTISSVPTYMSLGTSTSTSNQSSSSIAEQEDNAKATALYDYKASGPLELSIRAGDVIIVLEQDDGSGWVKASIGGGKEGLVPASYIEIDTLDVTNGNHTSHMGYVRVLYDYDAQSSEELTIREGDIIEVTDRDVGQGWWEGILNGHQGQFPEAYVEEYTE